MTLTLLLRRILMFLAGFATALGSSLATMENGGKLTLSQIGQVPLLAWVLALAAGVLAALNGTVDKKAVATKIGTVSLLLLAMGGMMSGCQTTAAKNVSQQLYVAKISIERANDLIATAVTGQLITPAQARHYAGKVDKVAADLSTIEAILDTADIIDTKTKTAAIQTVLDLLIAELIKAEQRSQSP